MRIKQTFTQQIETRADALFIAANPWFHGDPTGSGGLESVPISVIRMESVRNLNVILITPKICTTIGPFRGGLKNVGDVAVRYISPINFGSGSEVGMTGSMTGSMDSTAWYVVQCRANQNFRAQENLENQGFTCFQPRLRVEKLRAGRRDQCIEPLFPGYLFVQFEEYGPSWHTVRSTRGVSRVVAFGDQPASVPTEVIDALMQGARADDQLLADEPAIRPGDRLRIENGPFANLEATFQSYHGEQRAIVLLEMLHKQHRLNLALKDVRRLDAR